jgi:putative cell wall-binding protein
MSALAQSLSIAAPGILVLPPSSPVTGPGGFWTTPTAITLVPEAPGIIYYRFGAGPGPWTRCIGPIAVPEGKQLLSAVLVSPDGMPGDVVTTTIRSDFSVTPIVGVGAVSADVATYSGTSEVSGGVSVNAQVRAQVGTTVRRLGGNNRYDVSSLLADTSFGSATTVIIASGEKFPDALTAAGLAGALKAPLLLVQSNRVPAQIGSRITGLGATKAIVCGGPCSVLPSVVTDLQKRGLTVERINGKDRYEVATNVAKRIESITGGGGRVYIARGDIYPDALSLSPLAFAQKAPILLTQTYTLNSATRNELIRGGYTSARIAGGEGSVSPKVAGQIAGYVPNTVRWGGATRYEVAVNVATQAVAQGSNTWSYVGIAKGTVFSDALCGGVAAGNMGGVILLTAPEPLTYVTSNALNAHVGDVANCDVYGGPASVTPKTYEQIHGIFR